MNEGSGKLSVIFIKVSARKFSVKNLGTNVLQISNDLVVVKLAVQYAFLRSNTALDGPRINQSDCKFQSSYAIIKETIRFTTKYRYTGWLKMYTILTPFSSPNLPLQASKRLMSPAYLMA